MRGILITLALTLVACPVAGQDGHPPRDTGAGATERPTPEAGRGAARTAENGGHRDEAGAESGSVASAEAEGGVGSDADETGADETGADETGADETGADETGADETGADETDADETDADETGADETDADDSEAPASTARWTDEARRRVGELRGLLRRGRPRRRAPGRRRRRSEHDRERARRGPCGPTWRRRGTALPS
ncbi:MAG: hypothetical protein M5U28_07180 [Sandaracinaceae bacterium]|nr:hypothetical protein [Sandaracinaceae bacterium]